MIKTPAILLSGFLVAVSVAFAGGEPPRTGIAPPTRIPMPTAPTPAGEPVATASVPREVRRAVVADAARRFKVIESSVVITAAERLNWNDGSLGCPEPGMNYSQALVPGYRIIAKTVEGSLTYHTDTNGHALTCATPLHQGEHGGPNTAPKPVEPRTEPPPARTAPDR